MTKPATMAPAFHCDPPPESDMPQSLLAAQKRERDRILAGLVKIKGFMPLLMKPRNGMRWTPDERAELTLQLRALAHLSPYLAVAILPASFVFLPLLAWWLDRRRHKRDPSPSGPDAPNAACERPDPAIQKPVEKRRFPSSAGLFEGGEWHNPAHLHSGPGLQ